MSWILQKTGLKDAIGARRRGLPGASGAPYVSDRAFLTSFDFRNNTAWYEMDSAKANALFDTKAQPGITRVTMSFWLWQEGVLPTTATPTNFQAYFALGNRQQSVGNRHLSFRLEPRNALGGETSFGTTNAGSEDGFGNQLVDTPLVKDWHHWLIVFDGSQTEFDRVRIWIDGVAQSVNAGFGVTPDTSLPTSIERFYVGGTGNSPFFEQQGALKEFAVYTGQAFGQTEATAFYNGGNGIDHLDPSAPQRNDLSAYWRFAAPAGDGATVTDRTGNGNDLALGTGSPSASYTDLVWSPEQLGPAAWWDGTQGIVDIGGDVQTWTDRINSYVLAPDEGVGDPTLVSAPADGVLFGAQDRLADATLGPTFKFLHDGTGGTVLIRVAATQFIQARMIGTTLTGIGIWMERLASGTLRWNIQTTGGTNIGQPAASGAFAALDVLYDMGMVADAVGATAFVDGVAQAPVTYGGAVSAANADGFAIGSAFGVTGTEGRCVTTQVLVFDRALSDLEMARISAWTP